ncbi:MAG: hypothetical protein HFJ45_07180 [Clostridia bacterium]|nr:hypothetical protein [Clostridia bacterium]
MENILNKLTEDTINEIKGTEVKKIVIEDEVTPEQRAIMECVKRLKNPFKMLCVQDVMKDLNICETVAYKTFKRPDFPSINVGKNNQVMLIAYLMWKMQKRA